MILSALLGTNQTTHFNHPLQPVTPLSYIHTQYPSSNTQNAGALAAFYHELVALLARFPALTSTTAAHHPDDTTSSYINPRGEEDNSTMEPPPSSSTDPFTALARALRRHWGQPPFSSFPDAVAAADTLALPTLQCAPLGIRHEERLLLALLRSHAAVEAEGLAARGSAWWELTLATAYLNPPPHLLEVLAGWRGACGGVEGCGRVYMHADGQDRRDRLSSFHLPSYKRTPTPTPDTTGPLSLLAPSAAAHGFAGAEGLKAWIPLAYQLHEHRCRQLLHALRAAGGGASEGGAGQWKGRGKGKGGKWWRRDRLHRYARPGWTFHGKGLWLLPSRPGAGHGLSLTVVRLGFLCVVGGLVLSRG